MLFNFNGTAFLIEAQHRYNMGDVKGERERREGDEERERERERAAADGQWDIPSYLAMKDVVKYFTTDTSFHEKENWLD